MKAIILAGGFGSRLYPLTQISSKQLQPVFDKPMIYYPLTVLMASGIRDICLITSPQDLRRFQQLLRDGAQWGISIQYRSQPKPEGIAQAFVIAEDFVGSDSVILMLGDNILLGGDDFPRAVKQFSSGAQVFAYHVTDPSRYGVVEFDGAGRATAIVEKPENPSSSYAVPGVYLYDNQVINIAKSLTPSMRGEYEITDINRVYLKRNQLQVRRLSRGYVWFDAGTSSSLHEASVFIESIERRQGAKIGCPEEAALVRGFISHQQFIDLLNQMPQCEYRHYLHTLASKISVTKEAMLCPN